MTRTVQIAIIGAGTAGLSALREVRKRTDDFVLINDEPYGTTCARVGCMPSKVLIEVAKKFHQRNRYGPMGIGGAESLAVDHAAVMRYVRELRDQYVAGTLPLIDELGAQNIAGRARFVEPDVLEVNGERIRARRIILATGSRPIVPTAWHAFGNRVVTSDDIFELDHLPARLAVVGLGGVGAELAQAEARLGVAAHGFEASETVAGLSDPEVSAAMADCLREEFPLHLAAEAHVESVAGGVRVRGGEADVLVDKVLAALGRRPNINDLGLERFGAPLDERGVPCFDPFTMRIGELTIYVAGDANRYRPVLHEASDEGNIAGRNATSDDDTAYARREVLLIVFTDSNAAIVGPGWRLIRERALFVGSVALARQSRLRMSGADRGLIRLYAGAEHCELLAAELCAPDGEHIAHLLALAPQCRLTVFDLLRMPTYHPVVEEGLREAVREAARQVKDKAQGEDLALCETMPLDAVA